MCLQLYFNTTAASVRDKSYWRDIKERKVVEIEVDLVQKKVPDLHKARFFSRQEIKRIPLTFSRAADQWWGDTIHTVFGLR